jgi:hypothetical protein
MSISISITTLAKQIKHLRKIVCHYHHHMATTEKFDKIVMARHVP